MGGDRPVVQKRGRTRGRATGLITEGWGKTGPKFAGVGNEIVRHGHAELFSWVVEW